MGGGTIPWDIHIPGSKTDMNAERGSVGRRCPDDSGVNLRAAGSFRTVP